MKQWLIGVTAASVLSSAAIALCPGGRVKSVTRLVCGIVCALALISPLLTVDVTELSAAMAAYGQTAQIITQNVEEERKMMERTYIEEKCAAYISDKAAALGAGPAFAAVTARWDEEDLVWYPYAAEIGCRYSGALSAAVEAELGIPAERQSWISE